MSHLGLTDQEAAQCFPTLAPPATGPTNHQRKSDPSDNYNCIAHAYGIDNRPMWPGQPAPYWWPPGVSDDDTVESFVSLFQAIDYELCSTGELETGYEKVAIYATQNGPAHAARQLSSGKWTSKLGNAADIEHDSLDALSGPSYGTAVRFLRRAVATT